MAKSNKGFWRGWLRLRQDGSGAVAIVTALSLTAILGVAGLATEASLWYVKKRDMQGAADSAALSAATALAAGDTGGISGSATALANAVTISYGFNGSSTVTSPPVNSTVTIHNPPTSGSHTSDSSAYEVIISQPQPLLLSALFLPTGPSISARAVASTTTTPGGGNGCILALNQSDVIGVSNSGSSTLNIQSCSMYVNSSDPNGALTMSGSSSAGTIINAYQVYMVGGPSITSTATINTSAGPYVTGASPVSDPYAGTPVPTPGTCMAGTQPLPGRGLKVTGPQTLTPSNGTMTICGGVSVSGGSTLTLNPGTYVINNGDFSVAGGATVICPSCTDGAGVTIILTGTSPGSFSVSGSGNQPTTIDLTAPNSGTYAGIAVYQDPNAPSKSTNSLSGNSNININGALYFPNSNVSFSGGATAAGAKCTQIIASEIQFSGNVSINSSCNDAGTKSIGSSGTSKTALVE